MKLQQENKLYSYKMTHASGFAPNPYYGVLTLATCKPQMRNNTKIGNWIAGWTSKNMRGCRSKSENKYSTEIGEERLIYLAKVTDKLSYNDYWEKHPEKRPDIYSKVFERRYGDNIYQPSKDDPTGFVLVKNMHHCTKEKKDCDLKSKYVLICSEFYYFGIERSLEIPKELRPKIPKYQNCYGVITEDATDFNNFVRENADKCFRSSNKISVR